MGKQSINVGTSANDGTGDTLRNSQQKANSNFTELYDFGGINIKVNNPVTLTETTLDTALSGLVGSGGGSVNSVTGTAVDNTNPANPIVNVPTLQKVITAGNIITDGTPIILQNGSTNRLILQTDSVSAESASDGLISTLNAGSLIFIDYINSKAVSFSPISIGGNGQILLPDVINETVILTVSQEVTTNTNAINYCKYIANGTIVFTDPTPETNKGYIVHIIGGTSTIGGVGYTTGALVYRFYDGTSWVSKDYGDIPAPITIDAIPTNGSPNAVSSDGTFDALATKVDKNTAITGATKTKITYDSKGLVTAGADLVASDLPTGIDADKINTGVVSNTEFNYLDGVNAPIQDQIDLRKKQIYSSGTSVTHTGSTSETQLARITIPAGTLTSTDLFNINKVMFTRSAGTSNLTIKLKLSTSATMPSGTTDQIATFTMGSPSNFVGFSRTLWQGSGNINYILPTANLATDFGSANVGTYSSAFDNTSTTYYLYITATLVTSTDNVILKAVDITN